MLIADEFGARDATDLAKSSASSARLARLLPFRTKWTETGIGRDQDSLAGATMVVKFHLALDALVRESLAGVLFAILDLALAANSSATAHTKHWLLACVNETFLDAVFAVAAEEIAGGAWRLTVDARFVKCGLFTDAILRLLE